MRKALLAGAVLAPALCGGAAVAQDWLSLCGKCLSPSVHSKSGIGTANAVALARITRQDAQGWCENWESDRVADCVREQMAAPEARREYRASADCSAGRITPIDGKTYRLDGAWPRGSMGEGRSRWRDARGRVVGADHASGGLAIAQQWEVLCPNAARAAARPGVAPAPAPAPTAAFRVGQTVEALYGRQWVAGQVVALRMVPTARGRELHYEVVLANRQRGVVPARMLRVPAR